MFKKLTALFLSLALFTTSFNRISFGTNEDLDLKAVVNAIKKYEDGQKDRQEQEDVLRRFCQNRASTNQVDEPNKQIEKLQQELKNLKNEKAKGPSFWSRLKNGFQIRMAAFLAGFGSIFAILAMVLGISGVLTLGRACWLCIKDSECQSVGSKVTMKTFTDVFGFLGYLAYLMWDHERVVVMDKSPASN